MPDLTNIDLAKSLRGLAHYATDVAQLVGELPTLLSNDEQLGMKEFLADLSWLAVAADLEAAADRLASIPEPAPTDDEGFGYWPGEDRP